MKWLIKLLRDPKLLEMDIDGINRLKLHRELLKNKPMLAKVFSEFQHEFVSLDKLFLSGDGLRVELGSGVAPMRELFPDILATDIVPSPEMDMVLDAEKMNLAESSTRVFFGQNCFHHFSNPHNFFGELNRVLVSGGGAVLLEPFYGPLASFMYKRIFTSEGFDKKFDSWETPPSGPMNGANQALSFIVFIRDRETFESLYPNLKIVHHKICGNFLKYLLSGGLNFKQLAPDFLMGFIGACEKITRPLHGFLGLHHIIVIRKV